MTVSYRQVAPLELKRHADTCAVIRANAEPRADNRAEVCADTYAEPRAVTNADLCAEKNGTDVNSFAGAEHYAGVRAVTRADAFADRRVEHNRDCFVERFYAQWGKSGSH